MKTANIDKASFHIFWTTWRISIKFSEKMWLIIMLKVTENQGSTLSLEDTLLEIHGGEVKLTTPSPCPPPPPTPQSF